MIAYCGCLFLDVLSQGDCRDAGTRREKRDRPGEPRKAGIKTNKEYYDRSQYVIENKEGHIGNEAKNGPKRTELERLMRALNPTIELFDTAQVPAGAWNREMRQGSKSPEWGEIQRSQEMLIPLKVVSDSDLIPVAASEVKPGVFGAKRRWRSYGA